MIAFKEFFLLTSSTEEMCMAIKESFPSWQEQGITVRPDATGSRRTSNTSRSDHEIIRQAGFTVEVNSRNPYRTDRWAACNMGFEKHRVLINLKGCPKLAKELEMLCYKDGTCMLNLNDPLLGHLFDSFGYNVVIEHPVIQLKKVMIA